MGSSPLSINQVEQFQRDGFLVCPDLLPIEKQAAVIRSIEEISAWPETQGRWLHYREQTADGPVLTRTENFLPFHDEARQLLGAGILNDAISQLFGERAVVFKDKINYKLPGGGGFAPHQDAQAYAYGAAHITCLVAADECTEENGCLWFSPGAHRDGLLGVDETGCLAADVVASLDWVSVPMPSGGVTFFDSFAPHHSGPNTTSQPRRSLYVTYNRASEGDLRQQYYDERNRQMAAHNSGSGDPPRISTIGHFQGQGVD